MIYLLDTDHVSELQAPSEAGRRLRVRLGRVAPDDYETSIITFEEQMRGRLAQIALSGRTAAQSVALYALLNSTFRFYNNFAVGSSRMRRRSNLRGCKGQRFASERRI